MSFKLRRMGKQTLHSVQGDCLPLVPPQRAEVVAISALWPLLQRGFCVSLNNTEPTTNLLLFQVADPVVTFCETVVETSSLKCFAETPNKK